jgi:cell shape-determining protein MreC
MIANRALVKTTEAVVANHKLTVDLYHRTLNENDALKRENDTLRACLKELPAERKEVD